MCDVHWENNRGELHRLHLPAVWVSVRVVMGLLEDVCELHRGLYVLLCVLVLCQCERVSTAGGRNLWLFQEGIKLASLAHVERVLFTLFFHFFALSFQSLPDLSLKWFSILFIRSVPLFLLICFVCQQTDLCVYVCVGPHVLTLRLLYASLRKYQPSGSHCSPRDCHLNMCVLYLHNGSP